MAQFLMGNQILALAAKDAGAQIMYGYPITPSTEILETWIKLCLTNKNLSYLQTEDEMAAGFAVIGACLAGKKAFTATAGPGNVLMQDAFSMAEAQKIPLVAIITQRGGLSTSTVIYSQEEVRLTCFGGNGEGFRIVYSTAGLQDLYDYTLKAFAVAWKYRLPTFVLADGYQGKMVGGVDLHRHLPKNQTPAYPILKKGVNLRNCFDLEEEIGAIINRYQLEYSKIRGEIEEYEAYHLDNAQEVVLAHGIVAAAAKPAIDLLQAKGKKIGLFRPITLRPFPVAKTKKFLAEAKKILIIESALGQLTNLFKEEFYGLKAKLIPIYKPAMGFTPEEIYDCITKFS